MNPHVWIVLETRICHSAHIPSLCTLPKILSISFLHYDFLHLLVAHNAAPKYTIICLFSTVHDLCLVSLVHSLGGVLTCAHAHIRLRYYSWTHVVEHDLPFGISSPFFVEGGSINTTVYLRGSSAAHEVGVLNLDSSHVCGILPSVLSI